MPFQPEGVFVALWTPTDSEGRLLSAELAGHVRFLVERRVHGIMALGSTGEFPHLPPERRKELLRSVLDLAGPVPVIANISDIRPAVVADLGGFAREHGAAAVAVLPPYYYQITPEDLTEFFVRAAVAAALPLVLYNYPERTGHRIGLDTIAAVAERVPLAAIKQSGDEFGYHADLVKLGKEKGFSVFTGADTRLAEALNLGATGCISGLANAVPEYLVTIFSAARSANPPATRVEDERMREIGRLIGAIPFPLNMAAAMEARGLPVGEPKGVVSPKTQARYRQLTRDLRDRFHEWKLI
jgi:4-hydroxy-tetrahydrodipicolinate synthase